VKLGRTTRLTGAAATALAVADISYQAAAEARDRRTYPPPGRLVDVDGRRLHIRCAGEGTPGVVIIPAMGDTSAAWLDVQDAVAARTSVCVYDRPGLGWSDGAPGWPSAAGMARELHDLLNAAGIGRPIVLAGHSLGGLIARVFTQMYPDAVAGLVLVDSSHPDQSERLPALGLRARPGARLAEVALEFARPLAMRQVLHSIKREPPGGVLIAHEMTSKYRRANAKEVLAFNAICRQAGVIAGDLGDLPLAVLTSSERAPGLPEDSPGQRARSRFYPAWVTLQEDLAALSARSVHVTAPNAGHLLNRDDPALVARTITDLVLRVRAGDQSVSEGEQV
jgi:pimeloyl-ACP methyl ester carboxylesterase